MGPGPVEFGFPRRTHFFQPELDQILANGLKRFQQANVFYDHPFHGPWEYGVNIDFVNKSIGIGSRVSVELSPQSAKLLAETIIKALEKGEKDPQIKISVLD